MKRALITVFTIIISFIGIFASNHLAFAYYGTRDSAPYSASSSLKTGQIACFNEDPGDSLPCPFNFGHPVVIKSLDVYISSFDNTVSPLSYAYCEDFSSWYFQTSAETPIESRNYYAQGDFYCGNKFIVNSASGNWTVNFTYYDATTTITDMPLTDTHFSLFAGFFIFITSMIFIVWLFKRKI